MPSSVRGLKEAENAYRKMGKAVASVSRYELHRVGMDQRDLARKRLNARTDGFREERHPESIGVESTKAKTVVFIERDGFSPAAEFGAKTHQVYGRRVSQRSMKARTAAGWGRKGRMVGPEFTAARLKKRQKRLADKAFREMQKQLNKAGVPR